MPDARDSFQFVEPNYLEKENRIALEINQCNAKDLAHKWMKRPNEI